MTASAAPACRRTRGTSRSNADMGRSARVVAVIAQRRSNALMPSGAACVGVEVAREYWAGQEHPASRSQTGRVCPGWYRRPCLPAANPRDRIVVVVAQTPAEARPCIMSVRTFDAEKQRTLSR